MKLLVILFLVGDFKVMGVLPQVWGQLNIAREHRLPTVNLLIKYVYTYEVDDIFT